MSALYAFELVGRLAMDFGFGAFLEKFEANFGARVTRWLLAVMGIGIVVTVLQIVVRQALIPIYQTVAPWIPGSLYNTLGQIAIFAVALGAGAGLGSLLAAGVGQFYSLRSISRREQHAKEELLEAEEILERSKRLRERSAEMITRNEQMTEKTELLIAHASQLIEVLGGMPQSLPDTGSETPP